MFSKVFWKIDRFIEIHFDEIVIAIIGLIIWLCYWALAQL